MDPQSPFLEGRGTDEPYPSGETSDGASGAGGTSGETSDAGAATAAPSTGEVEFPPGLERFIRSLLGVAFLLVLLFPLAAALDSLPQWRMSEIDAGGLSIKSRAFISTLVFVATVFMLLLPAEPNRHPRVFRAFGIFLLAWGMAALFSVCPADSAISWIYWLTCFLYMSVSRAVARTRHTAVLTVQFLLMIGAVVCLCGLWVMRSTNDPQRTFVGAFYQADVAAGYLLLLVPLVLTMWIGAKPRWHQAFYGLTSIILTASFFLTYSRAGWFAMLAAVGVVVVLMWDTAPWRSLYIPVVALVVSFCCAGLLSTDGASLVPARAAMRTRELITAMTTSAEPVGKDPDSSVTARLNFYRGARDMTLSRPVLGWGPATFGRVFPRFQTDVRYYSKYAHCAYLTIMAEGGLVSLAAIVTFLGLATWAAAGQIRQARAAGRVNASMACGLAASLVGGALHVLFDVDWEFQMVGVLYFGLVGLLLSDGVVAPAAAGVPADEEPIVTSSSALRRQWALCLPILALMAVGPLEFAAYANDLSAQAARTEGHLDEAIAHERAATRWLPFASLYWRQLAELLLQQSDSDAAARTARVAASVDAARRAVALDPARAVNHEQLARSLLGQGDRVGAEAAEQQALRCDPVNYPRYYNFLGQMLQQQGRDREALALFTHAANMYPPGVFYKMWPFRQELLHEDLSSTWLLIGQVAERNHDSAAASRDLARAIAMKPDFIAARFQLGTMDMSLGRPGLALEQFRAIFRLKPKHAISQWLLGLCYDELGQRARARELLDAARQMDTALRQTKNIRIPNDFFIVDTPAQRPLQTDGEISPKGGGEPPG